MERTKKRAIKLTPAREALINNVLIYFPHWKDKVGNLSNEFLIAHTNPSDRWQLQNNLKKEAYGNNE